MSLLIVTHYFFRPTTNQLKQISMRQTHLKLAIKYQRDLEYRCSITLSMRCLVNFEHISAMYNYIVQFRQMFVATTHINSTFKHIFYYVDN